MLTLLGFATLVIFMLVVMKKWATAFVAVIITPIVFLLISGQGAQLGEMVEEGIKTVAPTAILLLFAVLYFGVMMDADSSIPSHGSSSGSRKEIRCESASAPRCWPCWWPSTATAPPPT